MQNGYMITRILSNKIQNSPKSVLLLGPRQVGKSTLLSALKPDLSINLADQSEFLTFSANPDELAHRISIQNPKTVFIDEIQRIPELLNSIQAIIDKKKTGIKFYLSGSSARKLRRGSANLLPGRLFNFRLGPISCLELTQTMDTAKALSVGCMPEPYFMKSKDHAEKLLESYTGTYLQEEIITESLVRQIHGFSRFLKEVAVNSGRFLDFSKLANKAKVNRSAARRYYEILEDTLLCERLESFTTEDDFDLVRHAKYYLFDVGIINAVLGNFTMSQDRVGHLFEHLFFNQLMNSSFAMDQRIEIYHFRTRAGVEVDFIIKTQQRIIAIEVKTSEPANDELSGLNKIDNYLSGQKAEKFVACYKCTPKKIGDISVLPWQTVIGRVFQKEGDLI